jgi:membrane-bound lytic murein transglycosylase B
VSLLTLNRRARLSATCALLGAALLGVPTLAPAAHAAGSGQLTGDVQSLLAKVHRLQVRATAAERRYSAAINGVADSVSQAINDDQDSSAVQAQAVTAQSVLDAKVRGLYESGGTLAAYASMLTSGNMTAAADQSEVASRVINTQIASVDAMAKQVTAAQATATAAARREHQKIVTESAVATAASRVESLLGQEKALLAKADKRLAAVRKAEAALAAETANLGSITTSAIAGLHILPPSAEYLALYKAAAPTCPGLSWTVLAAIGQVESGHGRNDGPSSAGAMGPMQFEPATFASYAVDGDGNGSASIMDPADAIFTAAHYLCANGAGRDPAALDNAILHYNHAEWYVQMVLKLAGMYATSYA